MNVNCPRNVEEVHARGYAMPDWVTETSVCAVSVHFDQNDGFTAAVRACEPY
jgi:hypothetical protein